MKVEMNLFNQGAGGIDITYHKDGLLLTGYNGTGGFCFIPCKDPEETLQYLIEDATQKTFLARIKEYDSISGNVQDENPVVKAVLEAIFTNH